MTDLNSLIIFGKVVEANSFSEASRRLKMPLSTISRRIADLEIQLGVRLLERSTRSLRLTAVGAEVFQNARLSADLVNQVNSIASDHLSKVSGTLRVSAPPSISDSLLAPLTCAFQESHPEVRVHILVTERLVDQVEEGIDLVFRIGALKDSSLIVRKILTYRHQLLASPSYVAKHKPPCTPGDLLKHRLLSFVRSRPDSRWTFVHKNGREKETFTFQPHLAMNDYLGLAAALVAGAGIGELPPIVLPELLRTGKLIEVMTDWHFRSFDLSLLHLGNRHLPRAVRVFKEFAAQFAPTIFPALPT